MRLMCSEADCASFGTVCDNTWKGEGYPLLELSCEECIKQNPKEEENEK